MDHESVQVYLCVSGGQLGNTGSSCEERELVRVWCAVPGVFLSCFEGAAGRRRRCRVEVQGDPASRSLGKCLLSPAPGQALGQGLGAQRWQGARLCP